jgi:hypothetical protein
MLKVPGLRNIPARILALGAVPGADWTPPRDKPLHLQSTADVWVPMLGLPAFGGILLTVPLVGTPADGSYWGSVAVVLIVLVFFEFAGLFMAVPGLEELRQRGAWLPPGYHRYPILVTLAVPLVAMLVSAALMLAGGSIFARLIG